MQNNAKGGYNVAEKDQKEEKKPEESDWFNMVCRVLVVSVVKKAIHVATILLLPIGTGNGGRVEGLTTKLPLKNSIS